MVEGGRIDHALHAGNAARAFEDTIALQEAIKVALDKTKREDTLIVVTADHGHTLTINGYPKRGNPILDKVVNVEGELELAGDGKPYTTIQLANGPGSVFPPLGKDDEDKTKAQPAGVRPDLTDVDTTDLDYLQPSWCRWPAKPTTAATWRSMPGDLSPICSAASSKKTTSTTC